jgi:integrase
MTKAKKVQVNHYWPDGRRTRLRCENESKANELMLRIKLAELDGTWMGLRGVLLGKPDEDVVNLSKGPFTAVADKYLTDHVMVHNKAFRAKQSFLNRFKKRWGTRQFRSINLGDIDGYVSNRQKEGVCNATINREIACLRHLYSWGRKRGFVACNPLADFEKLGEQEWAGPKPTDEIVEAVFAELDHQFVPVFRFIRETGARRDEALSVQRWQIDRDHRLVEFAKRTKNGKNRLVGLTDLALEALDAVPPLPGCPYVFYNPETKTRWSDCRKPWEAARKAAGYPWLRVRDLRPAFGTEVAEYGGDLHFLQSVLGHSSVAVTEKYYAKFSPKSAANVTLRLIEGGRAARRRQEKERKAV